MAPAVCVTTLAREDLAPQIPYKKTFCRCSSVPQHDRMLTVGSKDYNYSRNRVRPSAPPTYGGTRNQLQTTGMNAYNAPQGNLQTPRFTQNNDAALDILEDVEIRYCRYAVTGEEFEIGDKLQYWIEHSCPDNMYLEITRVLQAYEDLKWECNASDNANFHADGGQLDVVQSGFEQIALSSRQNFSQAPRQQTFAQAPPQQTFAQVTRQQTFARAPPQQTATQAPPQQTASQAPLQPRAEPKAQAHATGPTRSQNIASTSDNGQKPPEGLSHAAYLQWHFDRDMEPPEKPKQQSSKAAPKHRGPTKPRPYTDKLPFKAFVPTGNLEDRKRYPLDVRNGETKKNEQGQELRKDPSLGRKFIPFADDEDQHLCSYVYNTRGPCKYPSGFRCYANHNVPQEVFEAMVLMGRIKMVQANYFIKNALSNTPDDMAVKLHIITEDNLPKTMPQGNMTQREVNDFMSRFHHKPALASQPRPARDDHDMVRQVAAQDAIDNRARLEAASMPPSQVQLTTHYRPSGSARKDATTESHVLAPKTGSAPRPTPPAQAESSRSGATVRGRLNFLDSAPPEIDSMDPAEKRKLVAVQRGRQSPVSDMGDSSTMGTGW
ncbi:hypothetical protein J1614_007199 [Plenodomus biglobosus]|nr:hypothetical protein J1614_007199 [Plenodomus biglobosus]